jgi:hypothetical protein
MQILSEEPLPCLRCHIVAEVQGAALGSPEQVVMLRGQPPYPPAAKCCKLPRTREGWWLSGHGLLPDSEWELLASSAPAP